MSQIQNKLHVSLTTISHLKILKATRLREKADKKIQHLKIIILI